MKDKMKKIVGCIITAALTIVLVLRVGLILDPPWSQDGLDVIDAFHSLDDNSLDVIVYGSSHAWKGCDTRVMCDEYGIKAYNYGCNWQAINTIQLFVEDSLRTQTPKVVFIEAGLVDCVEADTDMDGQIYYTRAMSSFEGKRNYLKQCFGNDFERYVSYYFPLVMFHENWINIDGESFRFPGPTGWVNAKGFCGSNVVNEYIIPDYKEFTQNQLSAGSLLALDSIVKVCKEQNIDIVFYTCPYIGGYAYNDAMKKYAEDNNCAYLNLFEHIDDMKLSGKTDFQDEGHLNTSGARKVGRFLAEYVIDNYNVECKLNVK